MPRRIAPRLKSGESRVSFGGRLPSEIKEYIRWYADKHNCSMSWVQEQIIIDYFELVAPQYLKDDKEVKEQYLRVIKGSRRKTG